MAYTRTKVCGITSVEDAVMVADAGADAIGLNFYEPSPRYIEAEMAKQIAQTVGPFVSVVGLFVNAPADFVNQILAEVPLHVLQFHGDETPEFCEQFQRPYFKAQRIKCVANATTDDIAAVKHQILAEQNRYINSVGLLLDAYSKTSPGGTGEIFNWECVPTPSELSGTRLILAGGLVPDNVASAVRATTPYAVDVSSGVESAPGIKDAAKVKTFVDNARRI